MQPKGLEIYAILSFLYIVSNCPLADGDAQSLKEHLIDELDYILLPTEGWNKLVSWYTLMESQEPIARKVHFKITEYKYCFSSVVNILFFFQ